MKRVLFIAYAFPPCAGAGVQRTAKFVRYLPEYNWLPTVLTVVPSCYGLKDDSHSTKLVDGVEVIRTAHVDPVASFIRPATLVNEENGNKHNSHRTQSLIKAIRKLARYLWMVFDGALLIPDQAILWCPRAIIAGLEAHYNRPFDLIYATGEPYSDYLTASALSRITRVPFVIDMRDPWTQMPYRKERRYAMRLLFERRQEQHILSRCRASIFANRAIDLYAKSFPHWAQKFHYIPNGYDSADFEGVEPKQFNKFTIVHSGTFLPGYRTADTFLFAVRDLLNTAPLLSDRLQVLFVGKIGEERKLIQELSLDDVIHQTGYVPHYESVAYIKGADLLLLVGGKHKWEETGKVYEYIATGKPILALVHSDGAAADILRQYSAAQIVNRENVTEAQTALRNLLSTTSIDVSLMNTDWAAQYERKRLTGKLAQIFDECI